ncbi:MAG: bifunctional riboflavin kinase/FAD synthetase [Clostridia bacterium]|nr:bifunctional riboflavin kinase/FAD synthetase [Clostridia bacterium]
MKIYYETIKQDAPCCVALGFFDGVHTGHRALLGAMNSYATSHDLNSCVFTFSHSPCALLGKKESRALQTLPQRLSDIEEFSGAQCCYAVDFWKYREMSAENFVFDILVKTLNVRAVFCGFNFRFGKGASGDTSTLKNMLTPLGIEVFVIAPVCSSGETVSSSRIRRLIENGEMMSANSMLAHPFCISGEVVHGKQNGRTVGIPTINQSLPEGFVIPKMGAYASFAVISKTRIRAVTNIGLRPTISSNNTINCETHLLDDFSGDLYGEDISTELLWFEREERKFDDLNALAKQIRFDINHITELNIYERYLAAGNVINLSFQYASGGKPF